MDRSKYSRTVYSTESGRMCPQCGRPQTDCVCARKKASTAAGDGVVRLRLERKGRGGKTVSLVTGLPLGEEALRELAGEMKRRCGTGGAVKDGVIEIQGDHRALLQTLLKEKGYNAKLAGG